MFPDWVLEGVALRERVEALPAPQGRALAAAAVTRLLSLPAPEGSVATEATIGAALDDLWSILPPDTVDEQTGDGWPVDPPRAQELAAAVADADNFDPRAWAANNLALLLDPSSMDGEWWRAVSGCATDGDRYLRSLYGERFGHGDGMEGLRRVHENSAATLEREILARQLGWLESAALDPSLVARLRADSVTEGERLRALVVGWPPS